MKLPDDVADRAFQALNRPLRSHELADEVWPDRIDRPLGARSRAGHAAGRDLVERGWAIQNPDGTYVQAEPEQAPPAAMAEQTPASFNYEDGNVVEVRKRVLGPLPLPHQHPAPQAPQQPQQPHGFDAFCASTLSEQWAIYWGLQDLARTTDGTYLTKFETLRARTVNLATQYNTWFRALGRPELQIASLTMPLRPAPAWPQRW